MRSSTPGSNDYSPMRAVEVRYRPAAVEDLEQIYRFLRHLSRDADTARNYVLRIRTRCQKIGEVPLGGTARDDLAPGLRTVPFERRAVIAYRISGDVVEITNIFYGGRDFEAIYRGRAG